MFAQIQKLMTASALSPLIRDGGREGRVGGSINHGWGCSPLMPTRLTLYPRLCRVNPVAGDSFGNTRHHAGEDREAGWDAVTTVRVHCRERLER